MQLTHFAANKQFASAVKFFCFFPLKKVYSVCADWIERFMFPFVYVLEFEINVCLQTQLCRLIRLCTTRLLVWTSFQRWVLPRIANSHKILSVLATTLLSKEIQLLLITLFWPITCRELVCFFWEGTITVVKAQN